MESYCDFDGMSRMKLNYIVENPEYTKKLAGGESLRFLKIIITFLQLYCTGETFMLV